MPPASRILYLGQLDRVRRGVGCPAEDEQPLVLPGQKGIERFFPHIGVYRQGVRPEMSKDGFGIGLGRMADIISFGVDDNGDVRRNALDRFPQRLVAGGAVTLVEGDIGFIA